MRPFGLGDGVILVAATAVGLATIRAFNWDQYDQLLRPPALGWWSVRGTSELVSDLALWLGMPCVAPWTLACLVLSLRKPRPPLNRLATQPGAMACLVATLALVLVAVAGLAADGFSAGSMYQTHLFAVLFFAAAHAAAGVAGCWITLALSGRWRAEPSWLDRLGRLLGTAWIVIAALHELAVLVQ